MDADESSQDRGSLLILTYHSLDASGSVISVRPELFAEQMACLDRMGYQGVSLAAALGELRERGRWPQHKVVLTFDDGYSNLHQHAQPALARHGFSATVYLVTDHVGRRNDWGLAPRALGEQNILAWEQVNELSQSGWEIGAHTRSHPDLRVLPRPEVEREIVSSRDAIEDRLGRPVESFAYPFGYLSDAAIFVVERNFRTACTTELRHASLEALHLLPRIDAYYLSEMKRFEQLLNGRLHSYLALRRFGRRVRTALLDW